MTPFFLLPKFAPQFLANIPLTALPPVYVIGGVYLAMLFCGVLLDFVLLGRFLTLPLGWGALAERVRSRSWFLKDALWILLIIMLIQACAGIMHWGGIKLGWLAEGGKETIPVLVQGVLFHLVALLIIMVFIRRRHGSWSAAFGIDRPGLKRAVGQGLTSYVGIIPIVFVTSFLYQLLLYATGFSVTLQDVVGIFLEPQSGWSLFFLLLLAIVVAPFVEEALFRGILLPALMKKMSPGTAVVVSAAFFAAIHQHLPSIVPLFVLAVALALLYIYSGSLWAPVVLHAVFNGVSIGILLLVYSA